MTPRIIKSNLLPDFDQLIHPQSVPSQFSLRGHLLHNLWTSQCRCGPGERKRPGSLRNMLLWPLSRGCRTHRRFVVQSSLVIASTFSLEIAVCRLSYTAPKPKLSVLDYDHCNLIRQVRQTGMGGCILSINWGNLPDRRGFENLCGLYPGLLRRYVKVVTQ